MNEMIFIFLLALLVVGPRKLPELARQLGKLLAEFKRASDGFKNQLAAEMRNIEWEERAKKLGEDPKILPPNQPWEPLTEAIREVGRPAHEPISIRGNNLQPAESLERSPVLAEPAGREP